MGKFCIKLFCADRESILGKCKFCYHVTGVTWCLSLLSTPGQDKIPETFVYNVTKTKKWDLEGFVS